MRKEDLFPEQVLVYKNLNNSEFTFDIEEGNLTDIEKKLFKVSSDKVILTNFLGQEITYKKKVEQTEFLKGVPTLHSLYETNSRFDDLVRPNSLPSTK